VLVGVALVVDFRSRIAVAGVVAVLLVLSPAWLSWLGLTRPPLRVLMAWLARLSYAVFLLHYPISLVVATAVTALAPDSLELNLLGLIGTWLLTLAAAQVAERRIGAWQQRRRTRRDDVVLAARRGAVPVTG